MSFLFQFSQIHTQFHLEDLQLEGKPISHPISKSTFVEIGLAA